MESVRKTLEKFNPWALISLGIVLFLLLALSATLNLTQKTQYIKERAVDTVRKQPISLGYILEFKNKPLAAYKQELKSSGKNTNQIKLETSLYQNSLLQEHKNVKNSLLSILDKKSLAPLFLLGEYTQSFNGIALNITDSEAQKIKSSGLVKNVSPNFRVETKLMDSVPQIQADKVWKMVDSKGANINGKGVNIAIIDTGIDVTHPDLGATQIQERPFEKISVEPLALLFPWDKDLDRVISFDNNRLAYPKKWGAINIYDFGTQQTATYYNLAPNALTWSLVLKDDYLVYYAGGAEDKYALYINNIKTKEHKKIVDTEFIGTIHITNGKVIYERLVTGGESSTANIFVYDIQSETETPIDQPINRVRLPAVWGNLIAYSVSIDNQPCYNKTVIQNIITGEKKEIIPPQPGPVLDFKDNKILYMACYPNQVALTGKTYYLYNIESGKYLKLAYPDAETMESDSLIQYWGSIASWIPKGSIEDNVIFFSKNIAANKIIAYDINKKNYTQINLITPSGAIETEGNRVCTVFGDYNAYCHIYDPNGFYPPMPNNIFNEKVIGGYNFVERDAIPFDDHGHGTHVAGTAAGNGRLKGVAPEAKLIAYKVLDAGGSGWFSDVIAAIEMAISSRFDSDLSNDVDIISMSLGASCGSYSLGCGPDDPPSRATDRAVESGIVAVVAAGNSGPGDQTITSPGTSRKAITVGAVNKENQLAYFTSWGPVIWNEEIIMKPDIVAPGVNICAAQYDSVWNDKKCFDDKHVAISGTSMAAPHVAGLAALIKQYSPGFSSDKIKSVIKNGAKNLGFEEKKQGKGLIDALKSIVSSPALGLPSNLSVKCLSAQAEITWTAAENAASYYLRLDDTANGWDGTCTSPDTCVDTPNTWYHFNFTPGHAYRWWMHSANSTDVSSPVFGQNFTCPLPVTPTPQPTPTLGNPTNLSVKCLETQAEITWNPGQNANYYSLRLDNLFDGWTSCTGSDTCVDTPNTWYHFNFTPEAVYRWWMHSRNPAGDWGNSILGPEFTCPSQNS